MKTNSLTSLILFALAISLAATGCRKKPVDVTNLPGRTGNIRDPNAAGGIGNAGTLGKDDIGSTALPTGLDPDIMDQDRATLAANMVHFDYDSHAIRPGEKANVEAVASYMKSTAGVALLIEGHCDERGTEEYNRALGERRALSLREALIDLGADGAKMTTRSFGKDKKINLGSDEASHAMNRRGEFVVLRPK